MTTPETPPDTWFLDPHERGNAHSVLYAGREDGTAWSAGNDVRPLVDGAAYFRRMCEELLAAGPGDQVYFVDWRGDPDERLHEPGTAVMVELARAESAGAEVHGLVWRSHLDRFRFSEKQNRNLAQALQAMDADVVLDHRVRRGGSHHQKFVVVRHPGAPERDVAFVGGIDLGYGRRDDHRHLGDPQPQPMSSRYGPTPAWHDVMVEIRGPAVADVECCFRERWADPTAPRHLRPWLWALDTVRGLAGRASGLPDPLPPPPRAGPHGVQLLRTYPSRSPSYPFAPLGERTVARGFMKALARAETLVYVEDQFLWSATVASSFAEALRRAPTLQMVVVLPRYPDTEGGWQEPAKGAAQAEAIETLRRAGGDRVHVFDLENETGAPVYVHAKVCVVDDVWATVGSANLNRRSWTHDSELTAAVVTDASARATTEETFARALRLQLCREHLGDAADDPRLADPATAPTVLRRAAERLDRWHARGRPGPRPPGRLRPHATPDVPRRLRRVLAPAVRTLVDPDGRPASWRRTGRW